MPDDLSTLDVLGKLGFGPSMIDRFRSLSCGGLFGKRASHHQRVRGDLSFVCPVSTVFPSLGIENCPSSWRVNFQRIAWCLVRRSRSGNPGHRVGGWQRFEQAVVLATDIDPRIVCLGSTSPGNGMRLIASTSACLRTSCRRASPFCT